MDNWIISESTFDPTKLHTRETIFTIGNGYLGTRGTFEEGLTGDTAATLLHGVFDDVPVVFSELANTPNWLDLRIYVNGEMFRMDQGEVLSYQRELDLHSGTLSRKVTWRSLAGKVLIFSFERIASLANEHLLGMRCQVTSVDYTGPLEIRAGLPGHVDNAGWVHWNWLDQGRMEDRSFLLLQTRTSGIDLCETFDLQLLNEIPVQVEYWDSRWSPEKVLKMDIQQGETITVEKLISVYTSRDTSSPKEAAIANLNSACFMGFSGLSQANQIAWQREWEKSDITIEGDDEADQAMRYGLFQLLIAAPRHDDRVSIAAKALSGFGYRGHAFWDTEIFMLPFFTFTQPEIASNLLRYRFNTLGGARKKAHEKGFAGACYAWESAATGEETTPRWVPLPNGDLVRIWCGDIELHITADIVYAILQYWQATGDVAFMLHYGAEIILETARFWESRVEWNEKLSRYEINDVIGPDENHDHVNNNAYTNNLVRWNLQKALDVLDWLHQTQPEGAWNLEKRLALSANTASKWKEIIEKIYTGFDSATHLFEQFEGFYNLKELDLAALEPRSQSIQAMLGIEGGQKVQVLKQPDVLMLLYLLDNAYSYEVLKANWDYYSQRTDLTYGSSLGPSIQSILATRIGDIEQAYRQFMLAARTDLGDVRGNSSDGIHAATNGGLWQACVFGFGGLRFTPEGPVAMPHLPANWKRLRFSIVYYGKRFEFDLRANDSAHEQKAVSPNSNSPSWKMQENPPTFPILGTIFDLDGVLTDTSELHYLAWKRLADEEGIPFNRTDNEALRGISRQESLILLLKGRSYGAEQMQALLDRKNSYYLESLSNLSSADLFPGVVDFLEELRAANIQIAIGSASKNAHLVIEKLGISPWVNAISDGYSIRNVKPDPDLFLHAAAQLKLPANKCVVFEDAEAGVKAGLAGNFWVVGVGPANRVGLAHLVIPDMEGLKWQKLLQQLHQTLT